MKTLANAKLKKFLSILVIVVLLFNVITPGFMTPKVEAGLGGVLLSPISLLLSAVASIFQTVLNGSVDMAAIAADAGITSTDLFVSNIVFNQVTELNPNIFDSTIAAAGSGAFISGTMTQLIQKWYGVTRIIAISSFLVLLVYAGIKIITSTVAGDKAKYKQLLKDWILGLLLIFTLHFVMAAILFGSDAIVAFFYEFSNGEFSYEVIKNTALQIGNDNNLVYSIVWIALLLYTFIFLIIYVKRIILIAFFVVIAPLVVMMHSIEKIKGGSSGLLNKWLKEFTANVLMQPLDAMLFSIIIGSVNTLINDDKPLMALAFIAGFLPLRGWVGQFLGNESSMNTKAAASAMGGAFLGSVAGQAAGGAAKLAGATGKMTSNLAANTAAGAAGGVAGGAVGALAANALGRGSGGGSAPSNETATRNSEETSSAGRAAAMMHGSGEEILASAESGASQIGNEADSRSKGAVAKRVGGMAVSGAGKWLSASAGIAAGGAVGMLNLASGRGLGASFKAAKEVGSNISSSVGTLGSIGAGKVASTTAANYKDLKQRVEDTGSIREGMKSYGSSKVSSAGSAISSSAQKAKSSFNDSYLMSGQTSSQRASSKLESDFQSNISATAQSVANLRSNYDGSDKEFSSHLSSLDSIASEGNYDTKFHTADEVAYMESRKKHAELSEKMGSKKSADHVFNEAVRQNKKAASNAPEKPASAKSENVDGGGI